jgi:hypothetical protein
MDDTTRNYTPLQFVTELKAILKKAADSGVPETIIAHGLMGFAHAYFDECYGTGTEANELQAQIKANHPTWAQFDESMSEWQTN